MVAAPFAFSGDHTGSPLPYYHTFGLPSMKKTEVAAGKKTRRLESSRPTFDLVLTL